MASALRKSGHSAPAVSLLRTATQHYPPSADTLAELAASLRQLAAGPSGPERYARESLERRDELLREAQLCLTQALQVDPSRVSFQLEHAELLFEQGEATQALTLLKQMQTESPSASTAAALGAAYHRSEIANFDSAIVAYQQAITLDPRDERTMSRLNSAALRAGSRLGWNALMARQTAASPHPARDAMLHEFESHFRGVPTRQTPARLAATLHEMLSDGVKIEEGLLHVVAARLQGLGEFRLGFDTRHVLAERVADARSNHMPHVAPYRRWAAAKACLGHLDEVVARHHPDPWDNPTPASRTELDGILSDALFSVGEVRSQSIVGSLSSEQRMRELISDKRVAIVGPGVASGWYGEAIDSFDIVIRTRYSQSFVEANRATSGSRTDIAYYSGTDVHVLKTEAIPAAEAGALKMIVARPLSYSALSRIALNAPWLRFYPRDYSLIMNGGLLGITRIVNDILPFGPREVTLYNVDYYTGQQTFAEEYRHGRDAHTIAGSIVMDIFRAHDLLADFRIHQGLFARGFLSAPTEIADIARLSPDMYIDSLELAWARRAAADRAGPL